MRTNNYIDALLAIALALGTTGCGDILDAELDDSELDGSELDGSEPDGSELDGSEPTFRALDVTIESVIVSGAPYGVSHGSDGEYVDSGISYNGNPVFQRTSHGIDWSLYRRSAGYWVIDFDDVDEQWSGTIAYSGNDISPVATTWTGSVAVTRADALTVLDCGPVPSSPDLLTTPGTLSAEAKEYLLCQMNQTRSEVALGVRQGAGGADLPVATNMTRLQWDDDLATVAENYASTCTFAHNSDRSDQYADLRGVWSGHIGENIYATSATEFSFIFQGQDYGLVGGVESWSSESVDYDYDSNSSVGGVVGHFTQVARAETTRVGCGFYHCSGSIIDFPWVEMMLVCNYHEGQPSNQHPYLDGQGLGDVCTQGLQAGDTCANGLITPADYTTGVQ